MRVLILTVDPGGLSASSHLGASLSWTWVQGRHPGEWYWGRDVGSSRLGCAVGIFWRLVPVDGILLRAWQDPGRCL